MTQAGPLRWRTGLGWLVLGGGGKWETGETGDIDAAALAWADLNRPVAVLQAAGGTIEDGEALLEYYAELGGPGGYVVPIPDAASAQAAEVGQSLAEAGLIYVADGPDALRLADTLRESPALAALDHAFTTGAAIVGMGAGAAALGAWVAAPDGASLAARGWKWLPHAIAIPHFAETKMAKQWQNLLNEQPRHLGLGIPDGIALGLGPDGRVVTVGDGQVTVAVSSV